MNHHARAGRANRRSLADADLAAAAANPDESEHGRILLMPLSLDLNSPQKTRVGARRQEIQPKIALSNIQ